MPTLGWYALDWASENLANPSAPDEPFIATDDQAQFILDWYALDPRTGRRIYRRGVYSRSKGIGKSPLQAAISAIEALADIVPDGWDANGEPVGKPWRAVRPVLVQCAAYSADQVQNVWQPLLTMLREGDAARNYPGLDVWDGFVVLPGRVHPRRIEPVTAESHSREGNPSVHVAMDQTESWTPSNGGVRLAAALRRNVAKAGGTTIETPNAYKPGLESVAERTWKTVAAIREGRSRAKGVLLDHREAPAATNLANRKSLREGLRVAYGGPHPLPPYIDIERLIEEIYDPDTDPADARQYFLNQVTAASDAWWSEPEWDACLDTSKVIRPGDTITLGFDGSRKRSHAVTDATALIGCRVHDGHLFEIRVWEQPEGPAGKDWRVPVSQVNAEVRTAFDTYRVVGMYADPSKWESWIAAWEARYARRLKVKAGRDHPMQLWMTPNRTVEMLKSFDDAMRAEDFTHSGDAALTRHILNSRRRESRAGVTIAKDHPESPRKIDAAVAALLAWRARLHALAAGLGATDDVISVPTRIR